LDTLVLCIKTSKINKYFLKKIIFHFCVDVDATKTGLLTGLNRNTVNRYFRMFREVIYWHQMNLKNQLFGASLKEDLLNLTSYKKNMQKNSSES